MNTETYLAKGQELLAANKPEEALKLLREGLEEHPGHAELRLALGMAHRELANYPAACKMLEPLCDENPAREDIRLAFVDALVRWGRSWDAKSRAMSGCDDARRNTAFALAAAELLAGKEFDDEAVDLYEKALAYDPACVAAHLGLGRCQARNHRPEKALVALRRALELDPACWAACQTLGLMLYQRGRKPEAKELLDRVPLEADWQIDALVLLIKMSWRAPDRAKRRALKKRLERLPDEPRPSAELRGALTEAEARMAEFSRQIHPRARGEFWRGIPTIVPGNEVYELSELFGKIFVKNCRVEKGERPRVRRLDKHLFDQVVENLAAFLEGYPWSHNPPTLPSVPTEQFFENSGAAGMMVYGAAVLRDAPRRINSRLVNRVALLRLKRATLHLEPKLPLGKPAHRAWLQLAEVLQSKPWG